MTKLILYLSAVAALGTTVNGRAFWQPRATATVKMAAEGNPPAPTLPPKMSELRKRADAVVLVAPDNTCGYISGLPGAAYFCGKGATCAFIPATAPAPGAVACFVGEDVAVRVTCFDAVAVSSSSRCDNGCLVDAFTLKCTNSAMPFCNTISFPGNVMDYWCNTVAISTPQAAFTTYNGESDGRSFVAITIPETPDATASSSRSNSIRRPTITDPSGTDSLPGPTTSKESQGGGGGGSSVPIGPVVGGVVGGLVVLALIGLGIILLLRKRKPSEAPKVNQISPVQQAPPPPFSTNPTNTPQQSVYDPNYAAKLAQQSQPVGQNYTTTPPPQGFGTPPAQYQNTSQVPYQNAPPQGYQNVPPQGYFPPGTAPDRNQTTSPAMSQMTDNRLSANPTIPSPHSQNFHQMPPYGQNPPAQMQPTIHEAGGEAVGSYGYNQNHHGQMHELN